MKQDPGWEDDHYCFACGTENPHGLKLTFQTWGERGLESRFTPGKEFQGYKDIVHGGFIGLLLDEVVANLPYRLFRMVAVTAELNLRFHQPAPVGQPLTLRAWMEVPPRGKLLPILGEARLADGSLIATVSAKCLRVRTGNENSK